MFCMYLKYKLDFLGLQEVPKEVVACGVYRPQLELVHRLALDLGRPNPPLSQAHLPCPLVVRHSELHGRATYSYRRLPQSVPQFDDTQRMVRDHAFGTLSSLEG